MLLDDTFTPPHSSLFSLRGTIFLHSAMLPAHTVLLRHCYLRLQRRRPSSSATNVCCGLIVSAALTSFCRR